MKKRIYQIGSFILSEIKRALKAFIKAFIKTAIVSTIVLFILLEILVRTNGGAIDPNQSRVADLIIEALVVFGFALVYSLPVAVVTGGVNVLWKLCGAWSIVPFIIIPASLLLVFWLSSGWLHNEAINVIQAIELSAQKHGLESTSTALGGGGVHAGPVAVIFLVILIPYLLKDAFYILIDGAVLTQIAWFLLKLIIVLLLGTVPAALVSGLGLLVAFSKRIYLRFSEFSKSDEYA